jgi:hypothetical protein
LPTLKFDLKAFITDAVVKGHQDMADGKTSQAFDSSWYLTDVFAGFAIYSGDAATGLKGTFNCEIR